MIRPFLPADAPGILALNADNVPEVGPMDADKLAELVSYAVSFPVVEIDGKVAGAMILLAEGAAYGSPNYGWFSERHASFAYVDRIMLAESERGSGWGVALYNGARQYAVTHSKEVLAAEVNTVPPNERSFRFHERFGFHEVGREHPYGGSEEVAMFALTV